MEREEIVEIIKKCGIYGAQLTRLADSLNAELAKEKDLEWEGPNDCVMCDSRRHFCKERFTGKCKLAAEKPTASGELVEELKRVVNDNMLAPTSLRLRAKDIISRYSARKEVVLGEGQLIQFIDQTGRPSYFCATRYEGKRGKLIFVEEDSK